MGYIVHPFFKVLEEWASRFLNNGGKQLKGFGVKADVCECTALEIHLQAIIHNTLGGKSWTKHIFIRRYSNIDQQTSEHLNIHITLKHK